MKRTAEKILSIISIVLNVISIFVLFLIILFGATLATSDTDAILTDLNDEEFYDDDLYYDGDLYYEDFTYEEAELLQDIFGFLAGFSGILIVITIAAIILSIIAVVKIDKKPKNASIMLLISSFLSGLILSLQGILLLIAGILALVRKPPANQAIQTVTPMTTTQATQTVAPTATSHHVSETVTQTENTSETSNESSTNQENQ